MIEVNGLSFDYIVNGNRIRVLRGIDLHIREGESLAIIGANGSGKTTLVRCLNGLLLPADGEVIVDGLSTQDAANIPRIREQVGMVFQNPDDQLVSAVLEREIAFGLENIGLASDEIRRRVEEIIRKFRLERYRHHPPHRLSGGEKQRLAIASILAMRPKYLIMDEPTSLLDPEGRSEVVRTLDELKQERTIATIHITQTPEEAAKAERILVLKDGRVEMDGPPREIFQRAETLRAMALDVPPYLALAGILRKAGVEVTADVGSTEELADRLAILWKRCPDGVISTSLSQRGRAQQVERSRTEKISATGLTYLYDRNLPTQHIALQDIDLKVYSGEFLALVGPSGSGKTTLIQHFNGLLKPTKGRITLDGRDLWGKRTDLRKLRQRIGLVFQFPEFQLFEETVADDVAFGPRNLGWPLQRVEASVERALDRTGLDPRKFAAKSPLNLSGGEKRRAAIAGVLAMEPEVLVLDEPTAGLDPEGAAQISDILKQLHADGATVILISHDMDRIAQLAERMIVLQDGRVFMSGPPRALFSDDRLLKVGLDFPYTAQITAELAARGLALRQDCLTIEEVAEAIL